MYLSAVAVLTLLLLAWHYSIQAAAHDAAIVQVRTWLQNMNASAGKVQFHLLRGALTIKNINTNIQGSTLSISTLMIQGNPASITSTQPQIQNLQIQGFTWDASPLAEHWQKLNINPPQVLQHLFRYAKRITIKNGQASYQDGDMQISLQSLHVSGSADERKIDGQGTFSHKDDSGEWHIESFVPANTAQQTGKLIAQGAISNLNLNWAGAWQHENMRVTLNQHDEHNDAQLSVLLQQDKQQWQGDIQAQAWAVQTAQFESLISGAFQWSGTPQAWQLQSKKVLWHELVLLNHQTTAQTMVTHDLNINQAQQSIQVARVDIEDASTTISTARPLFKPSWQWDIANINVQELFITADKNNASINIPPMHGIASIQNNVLTLDISQQVNENEFWRIRSGGSGKNQTLHLSASHVPLKQMRNLLPEPIRSKAYTVNGLLWLKLNTQPHQQWHTTGKAYISDVTLASKNQTFSAQDVELTIQDADITGVKQANLNINAWMMQLPMTPRQAWSTTSHLEAWAKIPWSFDNIHLNQGKVVVGNQNNTWLSQTSIHISDWQRNKPAQFSLKGKMGFSPLSVNMVLQQEDNVMQWQNLDLNVQHANLFFLEDWLALSALPYITQGHASLTVKAQQQQGAVQGQVDLKLHHLQLLSEQQPNFLEQTLQLSNLDIAERFQHLQATYQGDASWSELAAQALLQKALAEPKLNPKNNAAKNDNIQHLGSLRIQQDIRLSLNERTRLRRIIKKVKQHKDAIIAITPDIGTTKLTPEFRQQILATQAVIQSFMNRRGIKRKNIYLILPQEKHQSTRDVSAVHINLIQ